LTGILRPAGSGVTLHALGGVLRLWPVFVLDFLPRVPSGRNVWMILNVTILS
jgi:hypothetical protein